MPLRTEHVITPEVVEELMSLGLRQLARERVRRDGWRLSDAFWRELDDLERTARAVRQQRTRVARRVVSRNPVATVAPENGVIGGENYSTRYVTIAEASRLKNVSVSALNARCRRGTLHYKRDRRGRRVVNTEDL